MVIIPCFNEAGRIGKTLDRVLQFTNNVCVIDDGSTDNTSSEIEKRNVKIIRYKNNRGKGYALRRGIEYFLKSNSEAVLFLDGDGQHPAKYIPGFAKKLSVKNIDVVVASRFGTQEWLTNMPFLRKLSNLLSRFGLWILFNGLTIEDPQNGYRAYKRRAIEQIQFYSNGYEAETEILIKAYLHGMRIDKIHIESLYAEENHSKFSLLMDTWKIPGIMMSSFFKYKPFLYRKLINKNKK